MGKDGFKNHFTFKVQHFNPGLCQWGMTLRKTLPFLIPAIGFFCSSCLNRAYFNSPIAGNPATYHAMPVASDDVKSATYVNGSLSVGGANERWRDGVYTLQAGLHRSHVLNNFRLNYGTSLSVGSYHVEPYVYYDSRYIDTSYINRNGGSKFFGAYGVYGGLSAASKMGRRGEWRYIGVEGSFFNEFGNYYSFRKNLVDTGATEIDKKKYMGSVGINTELIFKGRSKNKFGIKIAVGSYLRRLPYYDGYSNNLYNSHDDLFYFSNTYHFTIKKATTYFQFNLSDHAGHFQVGFNYRL